MKKIIKRILQVLGVVVLVVACYAAYVFVSYSRIEDNQKLKVNAISENVAQLGTSYRITSANIGFGAYSDDYSFFMDGGESSRAVSKEAVQTNVNGEVDAVSELDPDILLFQEVDTDGTRSYHVNEYSMIKKELKEYSSVFAQNYDSAYLFYPLTQPHGKNQSGMAAFTNFEVTSALRRSLPIETGFTKFLDLDRCYFKERIPVESGKELVVYNLHLSAYTSNEDTANNQLKMLFKDMQKEYDKGNYIVGGGDFNKDLLEDSYSIFQQGEQTSDNWAKPIPKELIPDDFDIVVPYDEKDPIPTCRNADQPYSEDDFVLTVDGFICSKNVKVEYSNAVNTEFKYSDHNPVYMDFVLEEDANE